MANTKLRSIGIERCTPKFLKKLGNPAFSKISWYPIGIGYQGSPIGRCESAIFPCFSAVCTFHLHSAGVASRRLYTNMQPFGCKLV
jgi:hypothetical protein